MWGWVTVVQLIICVSYGFNFYYEMLWLSSPDYAPFNNNKIIIVPHLISTQLIVVISFILAIKFRTTMSRNGSDLENQKKVSYTKWLLWFFILTVMISFNLITSLLVDLCLHRPASCDFLHSTPKDIYAQYNAITGVAYFIIVSLLILLKQYS